MIEIIYDLPHHDWYMDYSGDWKNRDEINEQAIAQMLGWA